MKKGIMIVLDGLGDRPSPLLQGQTPLEAATTPAMDALLSRGSCGLIDPLIAGYPVDTHTGTAALMGIAHPDVLALARGPVEAAGAGVEMHPGDVLLRANFSTLAADGKTIIDRRAGRINAGTKRLCEALRDIDLGNEIIADVFPATHHRVVVRLRGQGLSANISNTDPCSAHAGTRILSSQPLDTTSQRAIRTASALNRLMQEAIARLENHPENEARELPANALLARGAGSAFTPAGLLARLNIKATVISGERTLHGLGKLLGLHVINQPQFTADADTNLAAKFLAAQDALAETDLIYLHIKATDLFSHNEDPIGKRDYIESIDQALAALESSDLVIGISADHSTDSNTGNHCGDPVPSLISCATARVDSVEKFGERGCILGGLGRIRANEFLFTMLDHMGKIPNYLPFNAAFVDQA